MFVKDAAKRSVEISDGCDGLAKILFKGVFVNFTDTRAVIERNCVVKVGRQV